MSSRIDLEVLGVVIKRRRQPSCRCMTRPAIVTEIRRYVIGIGRYSKISGVALVAIGKYQ